MATGFGVDPSLKSGNMTGTTSQDIRKIVEGMYSNQGILRGCKVTPQNNLTYAVALGAVVCEIVEGESVLIPVYAKTVTTPAPPATGTREDYIVVRQNMPSMAAPNNNSDIVVEVVHTPPAKFASSMILAQYTTVAGKTRTLDFKEADGFYRNYAVPSTASAGYLFRKTEIYNGAISPKKDLPFMSGSFTVETDRMIEFVINTTVDCQVGAGIDDAMLVEIHIDNTKRSTFSTGKIDNGYTRTETFVWNTTLEAGRHTFKVVFNEANDTGKLWVRYSAAGGFPGSSVTIKDIGIGAEGGYV